MSSSIISVPTMFFISSILILISSPKSIVASPSSPSLIQKVCSSDYMKKDTKLCLDVLQSRPSVVSAKNLFDLSVAIIESGISNLTKTRTHVEAMLNRTNINPRVESAFRECKQQYDGVISQFKTALGEVKVKDYLSPTYDLMIASSDYIIYCEKAMAKQNVKDEIVSTGNKVVPIFGISAFWVIDVLYQLTSSPPSPPPKAPLHY